MGSDRDAPFDQQELDALLGTIPRRLHQRRRTSVVDRVDRHAVHEQKLCTQTQTPHLEDPRATDDLIGDEMRYTRLFNSTCAPVIEEWSFSAARISGVL